MEANKVEILKKNVSFAPTLINSEVESGDTTSNSRNNNESAIILKRNGIGLYWIAAKILSIVPAKAILDTGRIL
jgi:hypothetical protein